MVVLNGNIGDWALLIIEIKQAMVMDTSCAERWFSLMGRLKNNPWNVMSHDLLDALMVLCTHLPKDVQALKKILPGVIDTWRAISAK